MLLVLAAGSRLSAYIGATVGEIGFLRGFWLDGSRRMAWLEDYAASLTEHADAPAPERLVDGIRFEHVSFAYPGTERRVLDDVNLELKPGSVVAIVGENGAGKSTLVKLLCRMYQPDRRTHPGGRFGSGADSGRRMAVAAGRRVPGFLPLRVSGAPYGGRGRPAAAGRRTGGSRSGRAGRRGRRGGAASQSGLETQLGATWPGGVEVSFGQWQKFALARGFMRDHPLVIVLDEPTAALDAETEHALFERYCGGRARRPTAASRSWCRIGSAPCGWPT